MKAATIVVFLGLSMTGFSQEKINWLSIEEAQEKAKDEKRKVFIDIYTDWCGWCKRMDKTTFQDPEIAEYVNKNFYAVKMDGEEKDSLTYGGKKYGYVDKGRKGYNELPAKLMQGRLSYPTIVFLDKDFNMIQPVPGYQGPKQFEMIITFLGENHHKEKSFKKYKKNFEPELSK